MIYCILINGHRGKFQIQLYGFSTFLAILSDLSDHELAGYSVTREN